MFNLLDILWDPKNSISIKLYAIAVTPIVLPIELWGKLMDQAPEQIIKILLPINLLGLIIITVLTKMCPR